MNRSFAFLALALSALSASVGCAIDGDGADTASAAIETEGETNDRADGEPDLATLQARVQTLFTSRCAPCHTDRAAAGLSVLDVASGTVDVASSQVPAMKRIAPKDRANSYLFHKLQGTHRTVGGAGAPMPPGGTLSADDVALVGSYIDALPVE